jgi:hypothetical protein
MDAGSHHLLHRSQADVGNQGPGRLRRSDVHDRQPGSKYFGGVGVVDNESPDTVAFEIDRISAYQIDAPK